MTGRQRLLVLAACAVLVAVTAWFAGREGGPERPAPSSGSVRLGPDPGEDVAAYLARIGAELPAPGPSVLALVQFDTALTGVDALGATTGAVPVTAVFRVPLPRVQTALAFEPLDPGTPPAVAIDAARARAADAAGERRASAGSTDRQRAVAAAEQAALAEPSCTCAIALVVRGDRATLDAVAAATAVRAVHAAPTGTTLPELALAPLLPEQAERADPPPDDGRI